MKKIIFTLSLSGLLFSGYISAIKLFRSACALGESCPDFLGYPACYYGFAIFLLITIFAGIVLFGKKPSRLVLSAVILASGLGILFSGYFSLIELPQLIDNGFSYYKLGLPTCMIGFIFYILIFAIGIKEKGRVY